MIKPFFAFASFRVRSISGLATLLSLPGDASPEPVLSNERVHDRGAIEALQSDHHQSPFAHLVRDPGPIVLMGHSRPDSLNKQAQWLVGDRCKALDA